MGTCQRFEGKNMIITGATSGIGRATAIRAGAEGAMVVVIGRNAERGRAVEKTILDNGGKALFIQSDVTSEENVKNLFAQIAEKVGDIDVMVNIAGMIGPGDRVDQVLTSDWAEIMNTNLNSTFFCCREASKNMIAHKKGGVIINTGSVAGVTGFGYSAAYVASKHGVSGLTKAIAYDLAPFGIRCNSINPANTTTPLTDKTGAEVSERIKNAMAQGKSLEEAKAETMIGRKTEGLIKESATPEQQAATILYYASDEAAHITGAIVMTDGGFTAY